MKIVINTCFGGFRLSNLAMEDYFELKGIEFERSKGTMGNFTYFKKGHLDDYDQCLLDSDIPRDDTYLISVVEKLSYLANGNYADLKVVEIPDDVDWYIDDYDGQEQIRERHRTWS